MYRLGFHLLQPSSSYELVYDFNKFFNLHKDAVHEYFNLHKYAVHGGPEIAIYFNQVSGPTTYSLTLHYMMNTHRET